MDIQQYLIHELPQEESPDGSNRVSLFPQMPLLDLDSKLQNVRKFFHLASIAPARDRDNLKELEANFKESVKTKNLQDLQELINPYLQPPDIRILHNIDFIQNELSDAPGEISDYYQQLIQCTQPGSHDLGVSPNAQESTDRIFEYTGTYKSRYGSARHFMRRLRLVCRRLKKFCGCRGSLKHREMDRLEEVKERCQHPGVVLGNGLQYLQSIGMNNQRVDLISALPALMLAYSLIHQVPGPVKELEEKFNEDLGRWKTISIRNQPDLRLFEAAAGAAFAVKSFPQAADMYQLNLNSTAQLQSVAFDFILQASSAIQEMHAEGLDVDAPQSTMENSVGVSEDHKAPDQHDSGISVGTPVESGMYSQMLDEDDDYSSAMCTQPDALLGPESQCSYGFVDL
ncbi:hypothetical protein FVEG_07420 [Fusarium verticillioides 7600]|uniref:Uncharacterized protein n=1 Tax=Gibberella moniliformis (strain M3125 / FGSC 7600) TaxID=334819 RepID=W7M8D8_GIBM7|nr:hypothetical protein FVEG_07420 [Fusarium verticillioides 7600]EWG47271.1 hypothetical protein FVEG_07420 [Fusarium verticillioides 7600]RBQ88807.1 hypothetical protein FVER53263_07420 [Fusarium verticillioides]